jgi:hypothetical protein
MEKLKALFNLFRKGNEVADPEKWKSNQITANSIAVFLAAILAVAKSFGLEIPVGDGDIALVAGGVLGVVNIIGTIVTSKKAGLPAEPVPYVPSYGASPAPAANNAPIGKQVDWISVAERDYRAGKPDGPDYSAERGY